MRTPHLPIHFLNLLLSCLFFLSFLAPGLSHAANPGDIITVAGGGGSYANGPSFVTSLNNPQGVSVVTGGDYYIADTANHRIHKVNGTTGLLTTVAGNGIAGDSGDGGPALSASLRNPYSVAVDGSGNIYIADTANHRIRKVDSGGTITTVAGDGVAGFAGDGFTYAVAASRIRTPQGVAVDSVGNVYIADTDNQRIRRLDTATGIIATIAGDGIVGVGGENVLASAVGVRFAYPVSVAFDSSNNLFIADFGSSRIRKITASTNTITTVAGNGGAGFSGDGVSALATSLRGPRGVAVDGSGNIFIADTSNSRIRKVTAGTNIISTVAGNGTYSYSGDGLSAASAGLWLPGAVAVDASGNVYIADSASNRIRKVLAAATQPTAALLYDPARPLKQGDVITITAQFSEPLQGTPQLSLSGANSLAATLMTQVQGTTYRYTHTVGAGDGAVNAALSGAADLGGIHAIVATPISGASFVVDNTVPMAAISYSAPGPFKAGDLVTITATISEALADLPQLNIAIFDGATLMTSMMTQVDATHFSYNHSVGSSNGIVTVMLLNGADPAGNAIAATPVSGGSFTADNSAPTASISYSPAGPYNSGDVVTITLTSSEPLVSVPQIALSGANTLAAAAMTPVNSTTYSYGYTVQPGNGAVSVALSTGSDAAGNLITPTPTSGASFSVDNTSPSAAVSYSPAGPYKAGTVVTITATFSESMAGAPVPQIALSGAATQGATDMTFIDSSHYSYNYTVTGGSGAVNVLILTGTDQTGNLITPTPTAGGSFSLDAIAPTAAITYAPVGPYKNGDTVTITATFSKDMTLTPAPQFALSGAATLAATVITRVDATHYSYNYTVGAGNGLAFVTLPSGTDLVGNALVATPTSGFAFYIDNSTILTVAGGGSVNGLPATSVSINSLRGSAIDSAGDFYIADANNQRVLKIDGRKGTVFVFAGNGTPGFSGDGGSAPAASLSYPYDVTVDSSGNVYIADTGNNRIRKVDTGGIISTIAGNGTPGFLGDGGSAASANLNTPTSVAVDSSGNIYIADSGNYRIRKVDTGGTISTYAGDGTAGFSGDGGNATVARLNHSISIAADSSGNIYIADTVNQRIRKVDTSGNISTFAGNGTPGFLGDGGSATAARLFNPYGVAVDSTGNIYIADTSNNRIRKVDISGNISTFAGNGTPGFLGDGGSATAARLDSPYDVAVGSTGIIYIFDSNNLRIRKVDADGTISTFAGNGTSGFSGDGASATGAILSSPSGVAFDSTGNMYIADRYNHLIRKIDSSGNISTFAGNGTFGFSGDGGSAIAARLRTPSGVAVDSSGNVYIADTSNNRIRKIGTNGIISTFAGNGIPGFTGDGGNATAARLNTPYGVAIDATGNVYIADYSNHRIRKVNTSGTISTFAGNGTSGFSGDGGSATAASLYSPYGVAADTTGNVYIADFSNNNIRKVDTSGTITTYAGNGTPGFSGDGSSAASASLNTPYSVAVDPAGNVFIADRNNNRIRKVDTGGTISTVAGNGTPGFSGDGGSATAASFSNPSGVAIDSSGNVYIADLDNNRIRKIYFTPPPAPVASLSYYPAGPYKNGDVVTIFATTNQPLASAPSITLSGAATLAATPMNGSTTSYSYSYKYTVTGTNGTVTATLSNASNMQGTPLVATPVSGGSFTIDTTPPTATITYSTPGPYFLGSSVTITATFSEPLGSWAVPKITLTGADTLAATAMTKIDATHFTYAYTAAGNGTVNIALSTGQDPAGNPVTAAPTSGGSFDVFTDNIPPSASIGYTPVGPYKAGDVITMTATFSEPLAAAPLISLSGVNSLVATAMTFFDSTHYSYGFTVQPGSGTVTVALSGTTDLVGNPLVSTPTGGASFTVDNTLPTASISYSPAGPYKTGDVVTISATFSEAMAAAPVPQIALSGAATLGASNMTLVDSSHYSYSYTVTSGSGTVTVLIPTGTDLLGNTIVSTPTDGGSFVIDAIAPTAAITYAPAGPYKNGDIVTITATFSKDMALSPAPQIALSGTATLAATAMTRTDATHYTYSYNVGAGNGLAFVTLSSGTDLVGNAVIATPASGFAFYIDNSTILTVAGGGIVNGLPAASVVLSEPAAVAIDSAGNIYIADSINHRIRKLDSSGIISIFAGKGTAEFSGDGGSAIDAGLNWPSGVAVDSTGNVYISDLRNHSIRKVDIGGIISTFAGIGTPGSSGDDGSASTAGLYFPSGVAVDSAGNVYIADFGNNRIRKVDTSGTIRAFAGGGCGTLGDGGSAITAGICNPAGVAVDGADNVYIADQGNSRVRKVDTSGTISTFAGNGTYGFSGDGGSATAAGLNYPSGMVVDSAGNIYIADSGNDRIRKVDSSGFISTVAGNGTRSFSGDGASATAAGLAFPSGVAVDSTGNVYIADTVNNRIRKIYFTPPPAPVAALSYYPGGPFKNGDVVTIVATTSQPLTSVPSIALSGSATLAATPMSGSGNSYSYNYTVFGTEGTVTATLSNASNLQGTPLVETTGSFTIDTTPPTATITYSTPGPYFLGSSVTIAATFSEPLGSLAVPKIALAGADTLAATAMTKVDDTHFTYTYTAAGNGTVNIALSAGQDLAGNLVTATPTSGANFGVFTDVTAPTAAISYSAPGPYPAGSVVTITATFSEPMADAPVPQIALSGAASLAATNMTKVSSTVYTYSYTAGAGNGLVSVTLGAGQDLVGNLLTATPAAGVSFALDNQAPSAAISYSAAAPYKTGTAVTITAVFDEAIAVLPLPKLAISGANTLAAADMTRVNATTFTYSHTVSAGDGTAGVSLSVGTDLAGNPVNSTPTNGASFTVDNTAPTASLSYAPVGPYKSGSVVTITATFNESMAVTPLPKINLSGANTVTAADMTRSNATTYTYSHTVGAGDGTVTAALSVGTDLAGNLLTGTPSSGASFSVDNTQPTAAITYSPVGGSYKAGTLVTITATFSEDMAINPVPQIALSGAATLPPTTLTRVDSRHYTFSYSVGTGDGSINVALSTGTDLVGNILVATPTSGATFAVDSTPPTAAITYSVPGPYKSGTAVTITATFTEAMADAPAPTITLAGADSVTAVAMSKVSSTVYTYNYTAGSSNGAVTVSLGSGRDLAGNNLVATPTSGGSFTLDTTAPTAAITYSPSGPYKSGSVVTITATFSEPMADAPVPKIALSGVNTLAAASMTRVSPTSYTYVHTVGSGNGAVTVALSAGTDLAGNGVIVVPTSGVRFTVDNTAPTAAITYSKKSPYDKDTIVTITATFSETMAMSPAPQIVLSGAATLVATNMMRVDATHYTFTYVTPNNNGTVNITLSTGTDLAGNTLVGTPASGASFTLDNIRPTAAVSYSPAGPFNPGNAVTMTVTFSEKMDENPTPTVSFSGAMTLSSTSMSRLSDTQYTYQFTTGATAGTVTVSISGVDKADNQAIATPTSGGSFLIEKLAQIITFPAIASRIFTAADFDPGASASSGLLVSYTSSNTAVATIVNGKIHPIAPGITIITASQPGNDLYAAATSVDQQLTLKGYSQLTVALAGTGGTSIISSPDGIACMIGNTGLCSSSFTDGITVTLTAAFDWKTALTGWNLCAGTGNCDVLMDANKNIIATFAPAQNTRITPSLSTYPTLMDAYAIAPSGSTIQARDITFFENLTLNRAGNYILDGGFGSGFNTSSGFTTVKGTMVIKSGKVTAKKIVIRQ